jgi:threonylcarbamoyladenosine tRNA methylthiotransferase MtaB
MKMKIFLDSVGCRLNQSEIEMIANQFHRAGHQIVGEAGQADIVIINTCAVTAAATSDSRQKIRQAARSGNVRIFSTGCWVTIDPLSASMLPSVERVVENRQKEEIVNQIIGNDRMSRMKEVQPRIALPGQHKRTRAFIKVQDGCDNSCSYCITRIARGKSKSRSMEFVMEDIQSAVAGNVKEIVLTGAQLGGWGRDLIPKMKLMDLINAILHNTPIARLRLSSIEPWEINEDFFPLFENPRFCKHLHLPLQSGSLSVLKRMIRPITPRKYENLITAIRKINENIAITTDLIVGFPGETEAEFSETLEYIQKAHFAGGHVFSFSARPQTKAELMPSPVKISIKKERSRILRSTLAISAAQFRENQVGRIQQVLWEQAEMIGEKNFKMEGLTDNYLRITAVSQQNLWNKISSVELLDCLENSFMGRLVYEPDNLF